VKLEEEKEVRREFRADLSATTAGERARTRPEFV
jgi:hypothetical protein